MTADDWRPQAPLAVLAGRARLLAAARAFFAARGVLEVETPALVGDPVTDPQLRNIAVLLDGGARRAFLATSPEYHMKRLLAAGAPDIYQLGRAWRDGERGRHHAPEFTLLEWYRRGYGLDELAAETVALLATLAGEAGQPRPATARTTYRDWLATTTGIDVLGEPTPAIRDRAMALLGDRLAPGLAAQLGDDREAWLDLLVTHVAEPALTGRGLVVVTHYPAAQAMLARLAPDDPRVAERFEVYWDGLELANGYVELTDPVEQRARFTADRERRRARGAPDAAADGRLLAALAAGLPACAGVALGFDRAVMRALGVDRLAGVAAFAPAELPT